MTRLCHHLLVLSVLDCYGHFWLITKFLFYLLRGTFRPPFWHPIKCLALMSPWRSQQQSWETFLSSKQLWSWSREEYESPTSAMVKTCNILLAFLLTLQVLNCPVEFTEDNQPDPPSRIRLFTFPDPCRHELNLIFFLCSRKSLWGP